jgi:hypothetical protein
MYLDLTGERRKIRTEELYNIHSSANIIRAIKIRNMSWAGHVTRMCKISRGYLTERDYLENLGIVETFILKTTLNGL